MERKIYITPRTVKHTISCEELMKNWWSDVELDNQINNDYTPGVDNGEWGSGNEMFGKGIDFGALDATNWTKDWESLGVW